MKPTHHQQYCADIFSSALEGGINYWAVGRKFKRVPQSDPDWAGSYLSGELRGNPDEGDAFPKGDPHNKWLPINLETIEAAIVKILAAQASGKGLVRADIAHDILIDWNDPDACRFDAETADSIIQIALFGEIVFG